MTQMHVRDLSLQKVMDLEHKKQKRHARRLSNDLQLREEGWYTN